MKCRPGDLALVIKGRFAGSLVTCIHLESDEKLDALGVALHSRPTWFVDKSLEWGCGANPDHTRMPYAPDASLLPIRPEPNPCETEREESVRAPDLGDMDRVYRMTATDQLADISTRLARQNASTKP